MYGVEEYHPYTPYTFSFNNLCIGKRRWKIIARYSAAHETCAVIELIRSTFMS